MPTSVDANTESADLKRLLSVCDRYPFLVIFLTALIVRLAFVLIVPVGEAPDEHHHLWVIQFMREHLRLPDAADVQAGGIDAVYGSMPQLGYLPHVLVSRLFPDDYVVFFSRCGSALIGLLAIWAGFRTGQVLFPDNLLMARALPWTMAFHPQFTFVHTYSNNDSAASALGALIIYLLVLNLKSGLVMKRCVIIGCLLGVLALCKYNGLLLVPITVLTVLSAAWIHGATAGFCIYCLGGIVVAAGATSFWWFWRNAHEYGLADALGIKTAYETFAKGFNRPLDYKMSPLELLTSKQWWRFIFFSFWGLFGHMTRWLWRPIYFIYLGFVVAGIVGWLKTRPVRIPPKSELAMPAIWVTFAICILINFSMMVVSQMGGPQGRYFFICEIPIVALLLEGLRRLGSRVGRWAVPAFLAFNTVVCVGAWVMLARIYGLPAHLPS